jgi:hypothetical protein
MRSPSSDKIECPIVETKLAYNQKSRRDVVVRGASAIVPGLYPWDSGGSRARAGSEQRSSAGLQSSSPEAMAKYSSISSFFLRRPGRASICSNQAVNVHNLKVQPTNKHTASKVRVL